MKTDGTMQAHTYVTNPLVGGGENMPPRKSAEALKWGFVSGRRWSDTSWQLRWRSLEGADVKRMVAAGSRKEALELAKVYNAELAAGRAIPSMHQEKTGFTLQEAVMTWAANQVHLKSKTLEDYLVALNAFLAFLHDRYPAVTCWNEIRREYVELYFRNMRKAYDTQRRHLAVIRKLSKDMHVENEKLYPDFCEKARVKLVPPTQSEKELPSSWQLLHLLEWFRQNYSTLWAQLVLEIGAGLRGFEACFLRVGDVDLEKGTVAIVPSASYQLKNRGSRRVIPVCRPVVEAMRQYQAGLKVRPVSETAPLFVNHYGKPWTESGICCSRTKAMRAL